MRKARGSWRGSSTSRGQLTLEALLLAALALSLLLIAAAALARIQGAETSLFSQRVLLTELDGLKSYSDEICILGAGNSRSMQLSNGVKLNLQVSGKTLAVSSGNWSINETTLCNNEIDGNSNAPFSSTAYLWYEQQADGSPLVKISGSAPS